MASFVFVGDPRMDGKDTTDSCELGGVVFPRGQAVEVDEGLAERLRRHSHFAEADGTDGTPAEDRPRRGRPPKAKEAEA